MSSWKTDRRAASLRTLRRNRGVGRIAAATRGSVIPTLAGPRDVATQAAEDADPAELADRLPNSFGRYIVGRELARGGTSRVLAGADPLTRRRVAIKVFDTTARLPESVVTSFGNEARILNALAHPAVIPLLEHGSTEDGVPYLVMPLLEGPSLRRVLDLLAYGPASATNGWTLRHRLAAFKRLCAAVEHAHQQGIVHRDIKPSNVLSDREGRVSLADWGLARPPSRRERGTTGRRLGYGGTPGYMSPEQIDPARGGVGFRSDVWSLGAILFEIVTLRRAVAGADWTERVRRTLRWRVPPATPDPESWPAPPALLAVCARAMAPDLEDRFPSAEELALSVSSAMTATPSRRRWAARRPISVAAERAISPDAVVAALAAMPTTRPRHLPSRPRPDGPSSHYPFASAPPSRPFPS